MPRRLRYARRMDTSYYLTSREVTRLAGVSYRQLDFWIRGGLCDSLVDAETPGSGRQRLWSGDAPVVVRAISKLSGPLSLDQIVGVVPAIRAGVRNGDEALWVAVRGSDVWIVPDGDVDRERLLLGGWTLTAISLVVDLRVLASR